MVLRCLGCLILRHGCVKISAHRTWPLNTQGVKLVWPCCSPTQKRNRHMFWGLCKTARPALFSAVLRQVLKMCTDFWGPTSLTKQTSPTAFLFRLLPPYMNDISFTRYFRPRVLLFINSQVKRKDDLYPSLLPLIFRYFDCASQKKRNRHNILMSCVTIHFPEMTCETHICPPPSLPLTSSTARRKAQHSARVSTCLHAALALTQEALAKKVGIVPSLRLCCPSVVTPPGRRWPLLFESLLRYPNQVFYTCRGGYSLDRKLVNATNVSSTNVRLCLPAHWMTT